jgi:hypothetical protein
MFEIIAYVLNIFVIIGLLYSHIPVLPLQWNNYDHITQCTLAFVVLFTILAFIFEVYGYVSNKEKYIISGSWLVWIPSIVWFVVWLLFRTK